LTTTYTALIQAAFVDSWWNDTTTPIVIGADTFTQMEANFSLFWGLAIQLYEATLISDLTRFDLFDSGIDPNALNAQEQQGLNIFNGKAGCAGCHGGHFLSDASESAPDKQMDNIGVRPVSDDIGAFAVFGAGFEGKFKVSPLRNVELNGPYFHNGGKLTLEEVIDFYNRGGDFPNPAIGSLGLTAQERADLKAFLLTLTDERVRQEMAPFDHPELLIPSGHPGGTVSMSCADGINACDSFITLAAVGAGGRPAAGLSPLQPFSPREVRGDFEGDGNADVAIYRPGEGNWYILPSSTGSYYLRQWGLSTDSIVSGDYDGDGKADYAVWRPGEGNWYIIRSSDGGVIQTQWGTGTLFPDSDVPVPGDYDGDGKTDIAVWRPGDGVWYIIRSSDGAVEVYQWGTGSLNDAPVPGDYDGDGKTDCAVWRPGDGNWYIRRSSDGAVEVYQWGTGSLFDVPVPGDYDGDGKVDCAVWRQGEGNWYIRRSSDGAVEVYQWGTGTLFAKPDVPVPGDYDGDGKIDCAVWRPGDGYWYIRRSSDGGVTLTQWGADYLNDEPIWQ
jgi:hypothetical protein